MTDSTTIIPIYLPDEEASFESFDPVKIGEIITGDLQRKGSVQNFIQSIKNNKSKVEKLLNQNNNLFSEKYMNDKFLQKNQFLVGYNICFYTFQYYNVFLMNGSPELLDSICDKTLHIQKILIQSFQKNNFKHQRSQNSTVDNFASREEHKKNSIEILSIMEEDLQNIKNFNKNVQPKLAQYLEVCEQQSSKAYEGKLPLYQKQKYFIFKIISLLLKFFSLTLLLLKLPEKDQQSIFSVIKDNLQAFGAAFEGNEFLFLGYLGKIREKSKFGNRYIILKDQIEYLKKLAQDFDSCQKLQVTNIDELGHSRINTITKDPLNSFVGVPQHSLDSYISVAFHQHVSPNNRASTTFPQENEGSQLDLHPLKH